MSPMFILYIIYLCIAAVVAVVIFIYTLKNRKSIKEAITAALGVTSALKGNSMKIEKINDTSTAAADQMAAAAEPTTAPAVAESAKVNIKNISYSDDINLNEGAYPEVKSANLSEDVELVFNMFNTLSSEDKKKVLNIMLKDIYIK